MAEPNRLLADANILLELILPGRPKTKAVEDYLLANEATVYISILSVHIVYYYAVKAGYNLADIDSFVSQYSIASMGAEEYQLSKSIINSQDIEDAMQVAAALSAGCNKILTLDKALAKNYNHLLKINLI
jgi:predicted nucleic acid-binding protein